MVKEAWEGAVQSLDPVRVLGTKLQRTAKALRKWGQRKQSTMNLQFQIASEVILRLDAAQETRSLSSDERKLKAFLKGKCLALASLERVWLRQRARVRDLQEGDANTKYFHMKANGRRRKHLIPHLSDGDRSVSAMDEKLGLARDFFCNLMGTPKTRGKVINLEELDLNTLPPGASRALEEPFTVRR